MKGIYLENRQEEQMMACGSTSPGGMLGVTVGRMSVVRTTRRLSKSLKTAMRQKLEGSGSTWRMKVNIDCMNLLVCPIVNVAANIRRLPLQLDFSCLTTQQDLSTNRHTGYDVWDVVPCIERRHQLKSFEGRPRWPAVNRLQSPRSVSSLGRTGTASCSKDGRHKFEALLVCKKHCTVKCAHGSGRLSSTECHIVSPALVWYVHYATCIDDPGSPRDPI